MTDEIPQNPSDDLAARWPLMVEFETIVRAALGDDPDAAAFRVTGATLDVPSRTITPRYTGAPAGRRTHPEGKRYWMPDRPTIVDLAARTTASRSLRWDAESRSVSPIPEDWPDAMRRARPGIFDCELSIGDGWVDLLEAYCGRLEEWHELMPFNQVKEKFGGIRLYSANGRRSDDIELQLIAEHLSFFICEVCGAPGRCRNDHGWYTTRCNEHASRRG